ncbi:MAG: glycoside hydrolase family 130 protein [Clostridia bacterium]|nr:glycoside hydrolase family 130 protein [Clostridia bacterium]
MTRIIGANLPNIPWEDPTDESPVWRYSANPIIKRRPIKNVTRVFNSAVVPFNGKFAGIFRGETNNGIPYLFRGFSDDGINFRFDEKPLKVYLENGEEYEFQYAYDPRVVETEGSFYVIWCDGLEGNPVIGIARTTDFERFEFVSHPLLPYVRNGVFFPKKINGEYVLLSRPSDNGHTPFGDIYSSRSRDLIYWGKHSLIMKSGWEWWQTLKIGAGCAPIETDEGWLLFYHGVSLTCNGYVYSMGAAILDKDDITKVKYRCGNFLLTPEEEYETVGFVSNVVFPCAALCDAESGRIAVYYGGADTVVGLAFTEINRLMDYIKKYSR